MTTEEDLVKRVKEITGQCAYVRWRAAAGAPVAAAYTQCPSGLHHAQQAPRAATRHSCKPWHPSPWVCAGGKGAYGALECVGGDITGKVVEVRRTGWPACLIVQHSRPAAAACCACCASQQEYSA